MPAASEELTSGINELGLTTIFWRLNSVVTFVLLSSFQCFWIRDILVRIRIRIRILGSVPLSNGSGRPKNIRIRIRNTSKKLERSHKTVEIKAFLTVFAWWWKDPEPDPYLWLVDPYAVPGGPNTYGSHGSGCGSGSTTKIPSVLEPSCSYVQKKVHQWWSHSFILFRPIYSSVTKQKYGPEVWKGRMT
jgi:hypothetical protein